MQARNGRRRILRQPGVDPAGRLQRPRCSLQDGGDRLRRMSYTNLRGGGAMRIIASLLVLLAWFLPEMLLAAEPEKTDAQTAAGWVKYEKNPVLGGSLGTCFDVVVLRKGGKYRMWFSWRPKQSIALTESKDGL